MTLMLAKHEMELRTEDSPSWIDFAKMSIYNHLQAKGIPVGDPEIDDNLLFVGETSPSIQLMASRGKRYSVLLFLANPFHILSEMAIASAEAIYTINPEHQYRIRNRLRERFGGREFNVMIWPFYPKPFEPQKRSRKLIGILEPDFNTGNLFDNFYEAIIANRASKLYTTEYDVAFYTLHQETYDRLSGRRMKSDSLYYLKDDKASPLVDISLMPNAVISFDVYRYNPILTSWAQRIPVLRPDWAKADELDRLSNLMLNKISGTETAYNVLNDLVNYVHKIEELEASPRLQDALVRRSMLGDFYGDYSKFRSVPNGS